jgi:hypothetical protein
LTAGVALELTSCGLPRRLAARSRERLKNSYFCATTIEGGRNDHSLGGSGKFIYHFLRILALDFIRSDVAWSSIITENPEALT